MALENLPGWLISNTGFLRKLQQLTIDSVVDQFDSLVKFQNESFPHEDLGYMLTCASILAHSMDGKCQDAALRIAQFCINSKYATSERHDGAALVFDALVNSAAIRLAEGRNLLLPEVEHRWPLSAQLEAAKRKLIHTIELGDETSIIGNRFQSKFWESATANKWLSVSAPTSVGKSFILETWIQDFLARNPLSLVLYIVPTRALISEVETDLIKRLDPQGNGSIHIATMPFERTYERDKSNVMVFTQERLQIFLNAFSTPPRIDLLVVDEAHKIGDGYRGVFLQQVIESINRLNPNAKVIFASPFTSNPELLLEDAPKGQAASILSTEVTVNQNLIWASQMPRKPKEWKLSLCTANEVIDVGTFTLENSPTPTTKRLPFVAYTLSKGKPGNIIYENGAASAEKTAQQLFDCVAEEEAVDSEILALIELCEKTIHPKFLLNRVLTRGIAFHYGNMPLLVRSEIERLFSANKITYLVCTSTLVEGVNMSCKNIFVRGPKKGRERKMKAEDFWNLAGRAGRWGREFQGNVICVDANVPELWDSGSPPRNKSGVQISRSTDKVLADIATLFEYIHSEEHLRLSSNNPELEHVFSYLTTAFARYGSLESCPFLDRKDRAAIQELDVVIGDVITKLSFPIEIINRNPGISPLLMESLFQRFAKPSDKPVERLLLSDPGSEDALKSYTEAFSRISSHLSDRLGFSYQQNYVRALLVVRWVSGYSLSRLITDRIRYVKEKGAIVSDASVIREVMKDVEEIARYQAPKLLSCYNDLLSYYLESTGRSDLSKEVRDLSLYLELGLSQQTQIALAEMGLSRTAAVLLSELIAKDDLNQSDCINWISENQAAIDVLPKLVVLEVGTAFKRHLQKISHVRKGT